ncbi:protein dalmatian isoform X2 [Anastrepha ludens]|uniref:protein dalmatian isoform X2 n=1 Tax=Anastrepha ludens TaxID=28586 RepID=UPI0023B11A3A|nr:protein dalmatian isoform X2 [Anastrepha ludens]
MVKRCAQSSNKQDAQKECKKLTVKVKRINVDKKLCYSKEKERSSHKKHECEPKKSALSGCAIAVALQDQCTTKLSEETTKSKCHDPKSFKRAVVRLKRLKFDTITRLAPTDLSRESALFGSLTALNVQGEYSSSLCKEPKEANHQLTSVKKVVVRLKRFKFIRPLASAYQARVSGYSKLRREPKKSIQPKVTKSDKEQTISILQRNCKQFKSSKLPENLKKVEKVTDTKMKTRFQDKISKGLDLTPKSKERPSQKASISKNVPKKSIQPKVTKSDCKQFKSSKLNENLKKVEKVTNTKMKTRFQNKISKGSDITPKSKNTPSQKASISNNVFRKQHGLIMDLVMTPVTDTKMKTRFQNKISKGSDITPNSKNTPSQKASISNNVFRKQHGLIMDLVMTPDDRNNLNKLSLRKRTSKRISADANATKTLETIRFSPVRNSTTYAIDVGTLSEEMCNEESLNLTRRSQDRSGPNKDTSNSEGNRIPKNIANKPDLIEQLLCSDEEQQTHTREERNERNESQATKPVNRTHKFFHRSPKTQPHSNKLPAESENIFEFLSQSDTSNTQIDKCKDPAADIIKKMISDGKVRVAVNNKGTGRPILKRCQRKNRRKKQIGRKNKASQEKDSSKKTVAPTIKDGVLESEVHNNYDNDDDNGSQNLNDHLSYSATKDAGADEHVSDGGFSRLARSVLLQQTKKYENTHIKTLAEKRRLLEVARKFVSTPASNRMKGNLATADISPIQAPSMQGRPVCPSPWRIDEDLHLPSVFNFTKNTSYLPTFSSDYIPATPKKNKSNNSSQLCNETNVPIEKSPVTKQANLTNIPNNITSSDSSGCLQGSRGNDSNAENMPPTEVTPARNLSNNDENAVIFNELPNPRRTLKYRTPLKAINVIEVINLPPWKKPTNSDGQNEKNVKTVTFDSNKDDETQNADDLFGFEEFLDQSSDNDEVSNAANKTVAKRISTKRNLRKKLKELKKWRPKDTVRDTSNASEKPPFVFNENGDRPKQRLIKEMLCSTMINQMHDKRPGKDERIECNREEGDVQPIETDFFNDYEPEDSFQKKPQRTYARPVKRKRKAVKNFVMFLDSEESNSDSEKDEHKQKKRVQKKKRQAAHDEPEVNPQLESFVSEFNSMCKEVENYELLVE